MTELNGFMTEEQTYRLGRFNARWFRTNMGPHQVRYQVNAQTSRTETFEGRSHQVFPAVLIKEGVHNGLMYTVEALSAFAQAWNGVPIPVLHPEDDQGNRIACNDPKILQEHRVGRVFNAVWDDDIKGIKAELWIDTKLAQEKCPATLASLRSNKPVEISTGLYAEDDAVQGTWNGEQFFAQVKNIRPEHLALLPGQTGACSWKDGCGAPRTNQEVAVEEKKGIWNRMMGAVARLMVLDGRSDRDLREDLSIALSQADPKSGHWVADVYQEDGYFIYEQYKISANGQEPGEPLLFRRGFSIQDGKVILNAETTQVQKRTTYVTANSDDNQPGDEIQGEPGEPKAKAEPEPHINNDGKEEVNMERKDQIKALIEKGHFNVDQEEMLLGLKDCEFASIKALAEKAETPKVEPKAEPAAPTFNELLAAADPDVREMVQAGIRAQAQRKTSLVTKLKANARNKFTEDQLKAKSMDELEALVSLAGEEVDYSAVGGALRTQASNPSVPPRRKLGEKAAQ